MRRKQQVVFMNVRDVVLFPQMSQNIFIGRKESIDAVIEAIKNSGKILVLTQKSSAKKSPKTIREMHSIGTICSIDKSILLQDGTMKVTLTGCEAFHVDRIDLKNGNRLAYGNVFKNPTKKKTLNEFDRRSLLKLFVRAKPAVALDEDTSWFEELRREKIQSKIFNLIQANLNYEITTIKMDKKVKLQQKILEARNSSQKMSLIRDYLKLEIASTS